MRFILPTSLAFPSAPRDGACKPLATGEVARGVCIASSRPLVEHAGGARARLRALVLTLEGTGGPASNLIETLAKVGLPAGDLWNKQFGHAVRVSLGPLECDNDRGLTSLRQGYVAIRRPVADGGLSRNCVEAGLRPSVITANPLTGQSAARFTRKW